MTEDRASKRADSAVASPQGAAALTQVNADLNAFITLAPSIRAGAGPMSGWTVAVKDLIDVAGLPTTAGGSRTTIARRHATVVRRLQNAGVAVLGKTNMDEWGLGVTGRNAKWGDCRNPWDAERISGGSSSGSAAAVAAGLATIALGTDTAGSLRIPAALCGVTALKPGPASVPRAGVLGLAPTLDSIGPIARSARECAIAYGAIAGLPPGSGAPRTRVGIPRGEHWAAVEDDVGRSVDEAARRLERSGLKLIDVQVPAIGEATRLNGTVLLYEVAHRHGPRWAAQGHVLAKRVARQVDLGKSITAAECTAALSFRDWWRAQLARMFETVDVLLHPTMTCIAPLADERVTTARLTHFCAAWSLAGLPVLALPAGLGRSGMPVGASLVGPAASETSLLDLGIAYQHLTDWHLRIPEQDSGGLT